MVLQIHTRKMLLILQFFSSFLIFLSFCEYFQLQRPGKVLFGFIIGHYIVSSNNGLVFNILMSQNLHFLDKICYFSESFCQFLMFVLSQVPENLFHGLIIVTA